MFAVLACGRASLRGGGDRDGGLLSSSVALGSLGSNLDFSHCGGFGEENKGFEEMLMSVSSSVAMWVSRRADAGGGAEAMGWFLQRMRKHLFECSARPTNMTSQVAAAPRSELTVTATFLAQAATEAQRFHRPKRG